MSAPKINKLNDHSNWFVNYKFFFDLLQPENDVYFYYGN